LYAIIFESGIGMIGKIAIIGTAGRGSDAKRIDPRLYDAMYETVCAAIDAWAVPEAVSGGAAVADHLAVRAFLEGKVSGLTLYLPARFENGAFIPNPSVQFNPGMTSNKYHRAFSQACGIDSLAEIEEAMRRGAVVKVVEGFKKRNLEVAAHCSFMVALTFGGGAADGEEPWREFGHSDEGFSSSAAANLKDGGTAHTWGECWKATAKRHVNLSQLSRNLDLAMKSEASASFSA
jgi:hypothetical protein